MFSIWIITVTAIAAGLFLVAWIVDRYSEREKDQCRQKLDEQETAKHHGFGVR